MSRTTDFFIGEIERGRRENRKLLNEIDRLQVLIDDLEAGGDEEDTLDRDSWVQTKIMEEES